LPLRIADPEGDWEIEVPVRGAVLEAIRLQIQRLYDNQVSRGPICERIAQTISETILDVLEPDLRPPTDAQVRFALDIARELSVNLPGEALQYRGTMHQFLSRHSDLFYARRNKSVF